LTPYHVLIAKYPPSPISWLGWRLEVDEILRYIGYAHRQRLSFMLTEVRCPQRFNPRQLFRRKVLPEWRRIGKRRRERVRLLLFGHLSAEGDKVTS
jgi:hypothetical protein